MAKTNNASLQLKFGENLRKIREKKGFSLNDLASLCNLDKSNISKIENGHFNISLVKIFDLANGLDIPAKELLDF